MPASQADQSFERDWVAYYEAVAGRPPRETLLTGLENVAAEPRQLTYRAVDLGCGDGRDTAELLRRGWQVLAIDGEREALTRLRGRTDIPLEQLETRLDRFETLTLPINLDLINASFCLPFCPPDRFPQLWSTIAGALRPGGRFCGQLFGDRDSWAVQPSMTHLTRAQLDAYLQPFELELLQEEDHPGKTALGEDKHWHIFHLVGRKR